MKRIISLVLCCFAIMMVLSGCGEKKQSIKVYNAGEYIDTELIAEFEKQNNCDIIYETFDSNETMYTKLMSGEKYDVLIPSDYMIERLIKEDYLQKLDKSKISNYEEINEKLLGQPFDVNNEYTVPYFWGTVGILYDKTIVDEKDLALGWEILRNEKYADEIYMYDSERDSFMIALKALGYSLNTSNKEELEKAYAWLLEQNEKVNPIYIGDEVIDSMISGNKAMAIVYSGDAAYIMSENENLAYYQPEEGTNIWIDAMVMTKNCEKTDLAQKFMDFMTNPENATRNSEAVGYSSPVKVAFEKIKNTVYEGIDSYVPRQDNENDEFFRYQDPETKKFCAELWTKVKSH